MTMLVFPMRFVGCEFVLKTNRDPFLQPNFLMLHDYNEVMLFFDENLMQKEISTTNLNGCPMIISAKIRKQQSNLFPQNQVS